MVETTCQECGLSRLETGQTGTYHTHKERRCQEGSQEARGLGQEGEGGRLQREGRVHLQKTQGYIHITPYKALRGSVHPIQTRAGVPCGTEARPKATAHPSSKPASLPVLLQALALKDRCTEGQTDIPSGADACSSDRPYASSPGSHAWRRE